MSSDPDRIAVPTNGRRPHPGPETTTTGPAQAGPVSGDPPQPTAGTLPGGLSAQQIMVGFGIGASLLALAAGMARRRVRH